MSNFIDAEKIKRVIMTEDQIYTVMRGFCPKCGNFVSDTRLFMGQFKYRICTSKLCDTIWAIN